MQPPRHAVRPGDTLQGLCLQYNCSAACLKRVNGLTGDCIAHLTHLVVPGPVAPSPDSEADERGATLDILLTRYADRLERKTLRAFCAANGFELEACLAEAEKQLREKRLIQQLTVSASVPPEQARLLLVQAGWDLERAASSLKEKKATFGAFSEKVKLKTE